MKERRVLSESAHHTKNLLLGVGFFLLVGSIFIISLLGKVASLITTAHFDGGHFFITEVLYQGNAYAVVAFSPETREVTFLGIRAKEHYSSLSKILAVPIDAKIEVNQKYEKAEDIVNALLFHSSWAQSPQLNIVDAIRLYLLVYSGNTNVRRVGDINLPYEIGDTTDSKIASLFIDRSLYKEGLSIAVLNATQKAGVGSRFAKMLTNMGMNVISVTTDLQEKQQTNLLYRGKKTYTILRLEQLLHVKGVATSHKNVADIMISLGKDSLSVLSL